MITYLWVRTGLQSHLYHEVHLRSIEEIAVEEIVNLFASTTRFHLLTQTAVDDGRKRQQS